MNDYVIKGDEALDCLQDTLANMHEKYRKFKVRTNFSLNSRSYNSVSSSNPLLPQKFFKGYVGVKRLFDNARVFDDDNYVRSQDLVYCMHDIFHEERHIYQKAVLYQDKNASQEVVDMAKCDVISGILPEYEKYIYRQKPSEIDAERYGWQKAVEYFDTHFLDENGHPLIDAREEMMNELFDINRSPLRRWFGNEYAGDYESAIDSLNESNDAYKYSISNFFDRPWKKNSETYKQLVIANGGLYAYSYLNAKMPDDARQVLYEFAVDTGNVSILAFPCLKQSIHDVKSGKRIVVPQMSKLEQAKYNSFNLFNPANAENLRFQDVYNRTYDVSSDCVQSRYRSPVKQQSSRETSLNRLIHKIDYSDDLESNHEHDGLS